MLYSKDMLPHLFEHAKNHIHGHIFNNGEMESREDDKL